MLSNNLRVSNASSLNFNDAQSQHSGQYRVNINFPEKQSSSSQSNHTSKISPSSSKDLIGKSFKCFNCCHKSILSITQCRVCKGSQVIKYSHPIVSVMEMILNRKMKKTKDMEKETKVAPSNTKPVFLGVDSGHDVIKQESFVSNQDDVTVFCKICHKEFDASDIRGNAQTNICPNCARSARAAKLFGAQGHRQKHMHIQIPSPARLRKISQHVESEEGLSFMERAKRIHQIDSVQMGQNSFASCSSPRTLHKKVSKSSGRGVHHSFYNAEENKEDEQVQNILLGDELELLRTAENQKLLKSSGGLSGGDNLDSSLLDLWNGLGEMKVEGLLHFLDPNELQHQNDLNKSESSFKSLQEKMQISETASNFRHLRKESDQASNALAKLQRINRWKVGQESNSSFDSHIPEQKFPQPKLIQLASEPLQPSGCQPKIRGLNSASVVIQRKNNREYLFHDYACDICGVSPIHNKKYHCNTCEDYDLCQDCYNSRRIQHEHPQFTQNNGLALLKDREEHVQKLKQSKRLEIRGALK